MIIDDKYDFDVPIEVARDILSTDVEIMIANSNIFWWV